MVRKLIAFSFEPDSIGGFGIVCNGVHMGRNGAFSHCYPMTKQAFIEALHDRMKFNELLGIDIRDGWQNALKDAIEPFVTMTEDCDPAVVAQAVAQADVNVRGQEEVEKDMATLEKDNKKLVDKFEKDAKEAQQKHEEAVGKAVQEIIDSAIDEEEEVVVKKEPKKKTVSKKVKVKKEVANDERRDDTVAVVSENDGCAENPELPAEEPSTPDNA